jgi:hypothetical protein
MTTAKKIKWLIGRWIIEPLHIKQHIAGNKGFVEDWLDKSYPKNFQFIWWCPICGIEITFRKLFNYK